MSAKQIQSTKDYRHFERHSSENGPLDVKKHKKLIQSMKLYGFLESFPIVCVRDEKGHLIVKDGQHRLMIAETLQLPVHYVIEDKDFDVAIVNSTAKTWTIVDYARKYAANGNQDYADGIAFAEQHKVTVGTAFALLAGTTSFNNCEAAFQAGSFKIKDRAWADAVAAIYAPMCRLSRHLHTKRFIEACMVVCRVKGFKADRLLQNAERCREKLVAYSNRDAFLDMLESVYNFGRKELVGLKAEAIMTMRNRNATTKAKLNKEQKQRRPPEADAA